MYHEIINHATRNFPFLIEHTDVKYIPHFHDETELVYVIEGRLSVTVENHSFILNKGEICIFTPGLIHNLYSYEPNKTFVMKLFPVINLSNIQLADNVVTSDSDYYEPLQKCISDIMYENKHKSMGYELSININAEMIFLLIIRNMKYRMLEDTAQLKLENKNAFLSDVTLFLEQKYSEEFSLEDVAEHLNYTKSYFCHHFKRVTGVTFWKYYTIFRLEKAIQMIKAHPDKTYTEIAGACGFRNIRSFNQAFKEYHQCTPREYIKKHYRQ